MGALPSVFKWVNRIGVRAREYSRSMEAMPCLVNGGDQGRISEPHQLVLCSAGRRYPHRIDVVA